MEDIDSDFPYTKRTGTEGKGTDLSDEVLKDDGSKKNPHCSKSLNIELSGKNMGKRGKTHTIKFSNWPETKGYFIASHMCVLLFELKFKLDVYQSIIQYIAYTKDTCTPYEKYM